MSKMDLEGKNTLFRNVWGRNMCGVGAVFECGRGYVRFFC